MSFRLSHSSKIVFSIVTAGLSISLVSACGGVTTDGGDEDFPTGSITLTLGYSAGGSSDLIARSVASGSDEAFGVSMTVENQPGANGALAAQEVASSEPDGHELTMLNSSLLTITPLTVSEEEAVTWDDLDPIMGLSRDDFVLITTDDSPYENLEDLAATEGSVDYGTTGIGTISQLAQVMLMTEADIDGNEVSFDDGASVLTAVMGGQVEVTTIGVAEALPQIEAGSVRPLAVFSEERSEALPDVPTAVEEGYEVPVPMYRALALPTGASEETLEALREGFEDIVQTDEYLEMNEEYALEPFEVSGEDVKEEWTELADFYADFVEENNIDLGGSD